MNFFSNLYKTSSADDNSNKDGTPKKSILSRRLGRGNSKASSLPDSALQMITDASLGLSDSIQEILSNTTNLSGENTQGYETLLFLLNGSSTLLSKDYPSETMMSDYIDTLLQNMDHPKFIEICGQANLATGLFHALRLLRMFEIKQAKIYCEKWDDSQKGITFLASKNASRLLEKLCESSGTIEQVRQSLVKILTFPISVLPKSGLHIQNHSANIVNSICKSGLNSQQLWYLHEVQLMSHIVRQLTELTSIINKDSTEIANDYLLRGQAAEKEGMWITSLKCVLLLLSSTIGTSMVLCSDFEGAGGINLLIHILSHCSPDNFLITLNVLTNFIIDPSRQPDDISSFSVISNKILEFLLETLKIDRPITKNDDIETLIELSQMSLDHIEEVAPKEYILQGMAYSLLTMLSNSPSHTIFFEENYHILSLLLTCLPSLSETERISAVLTTFNYLCQCVDYHSKLPLTALCAATTILIQRALDSSLPVNIRKLALQQIDLAFSSIEAISRTNSKYASDFLKCGFLKTIVSDPFERLSIEIKNGENLDEISIKTYTKIILLLVELNGKSPYAGEEIRKCGINQLLRVIVGSKAIPASFVCTLLRLSEELSKVDTSHLQESIIFLLYLLNSVKFDFAKVKHIFDSLWRINLESDGFTSLFVRQNGMESVLQMLEMFNDTFIVHSENDSKFHELALRAIESILRFLSSAIFYLSDEDITDGMLYQRIANYLLQSQIFSSPYNQMMIDLLIKFMFVFSQEEEYLCNKATMVVVHLLPLMPLDSFQFFIDSLIEMTERNSLKAKLISQTEISNQLIFHYSNILSKDESVALKCIQLSSKLLESHLSIKTMQSICKFILKNSLISQVQGLDIKNFNSKIKNQYPSLFLGSILNESTEINCSPFGEIPHLSIQLDDGDGDTSLSASLALFFSDSTIPLPTSSLAINCWFKFLDTTIDGKPLPILFFESAGNEECIIFELNLSNFEMTIISGDAFEQKGESLVFKSAISPKISEWVQLTVCLKKNKRFASSNQTIINLFVDGIPCTPVTNNILEIDCLSNQNGEIRIGHSKSTWYKCKTPKLLFNVGPIIIFPEVLNPKQASYIFFKGPSYLGNYQSEFQLMEHVSLLAARGLSISNNVSKNALIFLEKSNMRGLENIVDPRIDDHIDLLQNFEIPNLPAPIAILGENGIIQEKLSFGVNKVIENDELKLIAQVRPARYSLLNLNEFEGEVPIATLASTGLVYRGMSFSECLSAIGGPDLLLPLFVNVSDETSLIQALKLLINSMKSNIQNFYLLHTKVFKTIAFLLYLAPPAAKTSNVVNVLFQFTVDITTMNLKSSNESVLLVDSSSVLSLIFNHYLWKGEVQYIHLVTVLQWLKKLVTDERFSAINTMKLSCLGICRWILLSCVAVMEKAFLRKDNEIINPNVWNYVPRNVFEVADYRDIPEEFIQNAVFVIRNLVSSELRGLDLDLLTSVILYSLFHKNDFSFSNYKGTQDTSPETNANLLESHPFCRHIFSNDSPDELNSAKDSSQKKYLSPLELFRIYLLRLLLSIYDDKMEEILRQSKKVSQATNSAKSPNPEIDDLASFRSKCSPTWFLTILENADEIATRASCLRLLGTFLQKDAIFCREFCAMNGFVVLNQILSNSYQDIPVLLPIIGILYRIPMPVLLHPYQIKSIAKFTQLLDLEECAGPILSDPYLVEQTLPLLHIYYDFLVQSARSLSNSRDPWYKVPLELLLSTLEYAIENNSPFKQLMQQKIAIEIHVNAFLSCTNAFDDFGSQIYDDNDDITDGIRDDYFRPSADLGKSIDPEDSNKSRHSDEHKLLITNDLGTSLQEMMVKIFYYSFRDVDNHKALFHFYTSFSNVIWTTYEKSFQTLVTLLFNDAIEQSIHESCDPTVYAGIVRNITNILVLIKSEYLYDVVIYELLLHLVKLFIHVYNKFGKAKDYGGETIQNILRDIGNNIRYMTFALLLKFSIQHPKHKTVPRLNILSTIREHLSILFHPLLDDSIECYVPSATKFLGTRASIDEKSTPAVLEALQGFASSNSNPNLRKSFQFSTLSQIKSERNKFTQYFCVYLTCFSYYLVLEEEASIRFEATRILSYIATYRKILIEQLLSNNNANPKFWKISEENEASDIDIYKDGLNKLVPNADGKYELFLRGGTDDNESEENRFADFSFWISHHSFKCDKVFRGIESSLTPFLPNFSTEAEEFLRYLNNQMKSKDLWTMDHAESVRSSMSRAEQGQKCSEKFSRYFLTWNIDGIKELTAGLVQWKRTWFLLKSSPLWGYCQSKDELEHVENRIIWRVDYCKGPERTRQLLVQDFSHLFPALFGDVPIKKVLFCPATSFATPQSPTSKAVAGSNSTEEPNDDNKTVQINDSIQKNSPDDQQDIVTILRQMNLRGLLKKQSSLVTTIDPTSGMEIVGDIDLNNVDVEDLLNKARNEGNEDEPELTPLEKDQRGVNDFQMSNKNSVKEDNIISIEEEDEDRNEPEDIAISEDIQYNMEDKLEAGGNDAHDEMTVLSDRLTRSRILREIIKGLISNQELKSCKIYNTERINGLETQNAVLIFTDHNIHLLSGFVADDTSKKLSEICFDWIPTSPRFPSKADDIIQEDVKLNVQDDLVMNVWADLLQTDTCHVKIPLQDVYSFYKRKHQLKFSALEITDIKGFAILFSCSTVAECEEILTILLERELSSSIFNKMIGLKNLQFLRGTKNTYNRLISLFLSTVTILWQHGEITNFEYLMFINNAAGRSSLDLTQYPVFPWVLSDYQSEELDLDDRSIYRDLSKPMGALGVKRAQQYLERYQTMNDFYQDGIEGSSPPFHYGTHYSCAGYVLHYLIRLQPYASMSLSLQGGTFDKPDRLFYNLESSWLSASQENLQDVRELIPEFYYLPDFLKNVNNFDLGITQKEEAVNDVILPKWANNDPKQFVRIHRKALESKYVSENLNHWIDLVFGYKQRGKPSIDAMNVFIHITYEDEVDIDSIDDPIMLTATLSQINNFGQTPTKLFHKSHPRKFIPEVVKKLNDMILVEPTALSWHNYISPPLCVVGATQFTLLNRLFFQQVSFQINTKISGIGDIRLIGRDKIVVSPVGSILLPPNYRRIVRLRSLVDGLNIQMLHSFVGARALDAEKEFSYHEELHVKKITCLTMSRDGDYLATGSEDTSVRVWQIFKQTHNYHSTRKLVHICTFSGHESTVSCIEICPRYNIVVSGSKDGRVCVWDYRAQCMIRMLSLHTGPVLSVSVNSICGYIVTLTQDQLRVYHLNGDLISFQCFKDKSLGLDLTFGRVGIAPPCGDWQDGVVAVTGHCEGHIYLWKLNKTMSIDPIDLNDKNGLGLINETLNPLEGKAYRKLFIACTPVKTHKYDITSLRLCSPFPSKAKEFVSRTYDESRGLDLFVGDTEGFVSRWTPMKLDQLSQSDLQIIYNKQSSLIM